MHVELFTALRRAAISIPELSPAASGLEFGGFDVENCPLPEHGVLASNIAFILAKAVKPNRNTLPAEIAEQIVRVLDPSLWTANILGGGFINVTPNRKLYRALLDRAVRQGADFFLASIQRDESVSIPPEGFLVDWGSKYLRGNGRDGFAEIADRTPLTRDDQLMLLALLGDEEIDHTRYLSAYAGRENLPWYLRRFVCDTIPSGDGSPAARLLDSAAGWFEDLPEDFPYTGLCRTLRALRYRIADSRQRRRPELYLRSLVDLVRAFYRGYNRPEGRLLVESDPAVRWLVGLCREVVMRGERLVVFPAIFPK